MGTPSRTESIARFGKARVKDRLHHLIHLNDSTGIPSIPAEPLFASTCRSAAENCNACGSGAAAAAVAAAKQLGKTSGILLAHTNSSKVMAEKMGSTSTESVGYAALIF